ncbi:MAG: PD40 domain-containing protein [Candidatus Zixiibacteriota bacterium]|nr:MAG: PD40 domain-containing protein [candidate division Zixibacteria bacterium]
MLPATRNSLIITIAIIIISIGIGQVSADGNDGLGYYRFPAVHGESVVFTAESDLWKVGIEGGMASRLTTHHGQETHAAISPDGQWVAFTATYEGPTEVYVMPLAGGLPQRLTYEGDRSYVVGWTPDGRVLYSTQHHSTLPRYQLIAVDLENKEHALIPLAQARYGCYDNSQNTLYFTRLPFQGSWAKRYKGGTAQNVWRFAPGDDEATLLTGDYDGTSKEPMWHDGRVFFISDRDGTMNIWSMLPDGSDKKQHTAHDGWDVQSASLSDGRVVYHVGADLYLLDLATMASSKLEIKLASDFDQKREKWIKKPMDWLTSAHLSPDGKRIALTARGQVFVAPVKKGRFVRATRRDSVRYRRATFMPDGKSVLALSDETGELEFWKIPTNGVGEPEQRTDNGTVLRWKGVPSPDGKLIAYDDKDQKLWIFDIERNRHTLVSTNEKWGFEELAWSPDSRWLAFVSWAENQFQQISIHDVERGENHVVTADRFHSFSPAWSPDGAWLYFISDRNYSTIYGGVWGTRQQEPFFDNTTNIYMLPLKEARPSPFEPKNELTATEAEDASGGKKKDGDESKQKLAVRVEINFEGLQDRLIKVPVPAGTYGNLAMNDKQLFWSSRPLTGDRKRKLQTFKIDADSVKVTTLLTEFDSFELSADGKKLMIRKKDDLYVLDAPSSEIEDLAEHKVDLSGWTFSLDPVLEWRQMFTEGWRLHRDYFYDPNMHNLDWRAVLQKYLPLVERISDRSELSNLLGQMISELEALHAAVRGGDHRSGTDDITMAGLGARLVRDQEAGGYRIDHIYKNDPDYPDDLSPLARSHLDIEEGDVILSINGVDVLGVPSPGLLLRNQAGKQVLLKVNDMSQKKNRDVIVVPINSSDEHNLRYDEWEYTRRQIVEEEGEGQIGYLHLRSTGTSQFGPFAREFYPVYQRQGLIIDLRHNTGGNIDPWIINRLTRRAWAWWQARRGKPYPNMQYAFTGHMVVLCNDWTGSDGELLTEGLRRLCGAKVIGTRTWGGEIWLSWSNRLVDRGIASAAESGVFGPEGEWLIEGHGVDPDIVVDNLPHSTFGGEDAQLDAAIRYLKEQIREHPVETPEPPPYPDKSQR